MKNPTLASNWDEIYTDREYIDPEIKATRRLLAAIIGRAILDYRCEFSSTLDHEECGKITKNKAEFWLFMEGNDPEKVHSFAWCCAGLDMDIKVLRVQIKDLIKYQGLKTYFYKLGNIRTFGQHKRVPKANF